MNKWEKVLAERYPRPNIDLVSSYYFSLDGGGREIIIDAIKQNSVSLMLEIGCFLCGSTVQWLAAKENLKIIGVDPWDANFADILKRYDGNPTFEPCFKGIEDRKIFIESVRTHGPYISAVANARLYGDRFIPVKAYSPKVLYELADIGVQPDLIYFDSNKILDDLNVCLELFPSAILSGDDWTWGGDQGFPVQQAVNLFCSQHGYKVISKHASWVIADRK